MCGGDSDYTEKDKKEAVRNIDYSLDFVSLTLFLG